MAAKTISLRFFYALLGVIVIIITFLFLFLYGRGIDLPLASLPLVGEITRPHLLYNIYGFRESKLLKPMAVFYDNNNRTLYISNTEGNKVEVFNSKGDYQFSFGGFGSLPGQLSYPYGIARMADGSLLVAEAGNQRIQRFTPQGQYMGIFLQQPNPYHIVKPGPLYIDSRGNIYVADLSGNKVVVLNEKGKVVRVFDRVQYPHGIAVDEKNNLIYITNSGSQEVEVYRLDKDSKIPERSITGYPDGSGNKKFGVVRGIAVDRKGKLFVLDSLAGSVNVFDAKGIYSFSFGSAGYDDGQMLYPNGIDVDDEGKIYVADWANNRVAVWGY